MGSKCMNWLVISPSSRSCVWCLCFGPDQTCEGAPGSSPHSEQQKAEGTRNSLNAWHCHGNDSSKKGCTAVLTTLLRRFLTPALLNHLADVDLPGVNAFQEMFATAKANPGPIWVGDIDTDQAKVRQQLQQLYPDQELSWREATMDFFFASAFRPVWPGRCDLSFICIPRHDSRPEPGGSRTAASCPPQTRRPSAIPLHNSAG